MSEICSNCGTNEGVGCKEHSLDEPSAPLSKDQPPSRNSTILESFVDYCRANPGHRFWQALRNWSGYHYILVAEADSGSGGWNKERDTFNWEGKKYNDPAPAALPAVSPNEVTTEQMLYRALKHGDAGSREFFLKAYAHLDVDSPDPASPQPPSADPNFDQLADWIMEGNGRPLERVRKALEIAHERGKVAALAAPGVPPAPPDETLTEITLKYDLCNLIYPSEDGGVLSTNGKIGKALKEAFDLGRARAGVPPEKQESASLTDAINIAASNFLTRSDVNKQYIAGYTDCRNEIVTRLRAATNPVGQGEASNVWAEAVTKFRRLLKENNLHGHYNLFVQCFNDLFEQEIDSQRKRKYCDECGAFLANYAHAGDCSRHTARANPVGSPAAIVQMACCKCGLSGPTVEPRGKGYYCAACWEKIASRNPPSYVAEIFKEMNNLGFQAHDLSWRQLGKFIKAAFQAEARTQSAGPTKDGSKRCSWCSVEESLHFGPKFGHKFKRPRKSRPPASEAPQTEKHWEGRNNE